MLFSRTVFKKTTNQHIGVPHTLKCSVRDPARLKAQSEGTESNYNYRIKRFFFLILLISVKFYLCKISRIEEALLFVAETKPFHKEYCVPKNHSHNEELIDSELSPIYRNYSFELQD